MLLADGRRRLLPHDMLADAGDDPLRLVYQDVRQALLQGLVLRVAVVLLAGRGALLQPPERMIRRHPHHDLQAGVPCRGYRLGVRVLDRCGRYE